MSDIQLKESLKEIERTIKYLPNDEDKKASIYFLNEMMSPENIDLARIKSPRIILETYRKTLFDRDILLYQKFKKTLSYLKEKWDDDPFYSESSAEKRLETAALKGCLVNLDFGDDEIRLGDQVVKIEGAHLLITDSGYNGGVASFGTNRKLPYNAFKGVLYSKYKTFEDNEYERFQNQVRISIDPIWIKSVVCYGRMNGEEVKTNRNLEPWNEDYGLLLLSKKEKKTNLELFELLINKQDLSIEEKFHIAKIDMNFILEFDKLEKEFCLKIAESAISEHVFSHVYRVSDNNPDILINYIENKTKNKIKINSSNLIITKPSDKILLKQINKLLVSNNPENIKNLTSKEQTRDICLLAIRKNPNLLRFIESPTQSICEMAIKNKETAKKYVPKKILDKINSQKKTTRARLR